MQLIRIFLLLFNIVFVTLLSAEQAFSGSSNDMKRESDPDDDITKIETLIPEDLSEVTATLAQVMIYENAMHLKDAEVKKDQNYLYSISDLLKIKEEMNNNFNRSGNSRGKSSEKINVKSSVKSSVKSGRDKELKKLKPRYDVSLKSKNDVKGKLGDMTYHKKMLEKLMLETLFRLGQINKDKNLGEGVSLEVDGLVVDQTVSKIGRDFYEIFYANWIPPLEAKNFTVTIKEMPPRMNRVSVSIIINDDEVFSSFLSPRADVIEAYAMYAIQIAVKYLVDLENVSRTLEEGDMSGTGIY